MTTGYVVGPCFEKSANVVESPVMNNIRENIETVLLAVGAGERTRARFRIEPIWDRCHVTAHPNNKAR